MGVVVVGVCSLWFVSLPLWASILPFNGFLGVLWVFPCFCPFVASSGVSVRYTGFAFFGACGWACRIFESVRQA